MARGSCSRRRQRHAAWPRLASASLARARLRAHLPKRSPNSYSSRHWSPGPLLRSTRGREGRGESPPAAHWGPKPLASPEGTAGGRKKSAPPSPAPVPRGQAAPRRAHLKNFRMRFIAMVTASASTPSWRRCVRAWATQRPTAASLRAGSIFRAKAACRAHLQHSGELAATASGPPHPAEPRGIAASDCLPLALASRGQRPARARRLGEPGTPR